MRRFLLIAALMATPTAALAQATTTSNIFGDFRPGSSQPIDVEADSLEVNEGKDQRVQVFKGNVAVHRGETLLKAAVITIFSPPGEPKPGADAFNRIEATGKVTVTSNGQTATSEAATFDSKTQTAVLTGGVILTQGTNVLTGERLSVDLKSGVARIEQGAGGRIRGVFTPGAAGTPAGR
ncbi:MAG: LptA/OstA family protein [Bauldia sp.]